MSKTDSAAELGGGALNISGKQLVDIVQLLTVQKPQEGNSDDQADGASSSPPSTAATTTSSAAKKQTSSTGQKPESECEHVQTCNGQWERTLTDEKDELTALQELGLGVAVDITAQHPWVTKSAFQAKLVESKDLIVINESNKFHKSKEHVERYSDIQAGLESSFRPDPSTPINVTVAADFHRSTARSKTIASESVLTRTVAFRAKVPCASDSEEAFEEVLHQWLVKKGCTTDKHTDPAQREYDQTTNHHCIEYLKELGGVTHYVSSITLGATTYHVSSNYTVFTSASSSSGITADSIISASVNSKASRKIFQSHSKEQKIGKIPEGDSRVLPFRTKGEAVVKCSYNSLANLVTNAKLRIMLERGIHEYIDSKKNGTRGPYHIATAELIPYESSRERLYWKVDWDTKLQNDNASQIKRKPTPKKGEASNGSQKKCKPTSNGFQIKYTPKKGEASNFYLKPIIAPHGEDKYFRIATDPEDRRGFEKMPSKGSDSKSQMNSNGLGVEDASESATLNIDSTVDPEKVSQAEKKGDTPADSETVIEPQRYVNVVVTRLFVELDVKRRKKDDSVFKLKNAQDGKMHPLSKSQWLPEAIMGSQPYILCRKGEPLSSKFNSNLNSVYINAQKGCVTIGSHEDDHVEYSYFILENGHAT